MVTQNTTTATGEAGLVNIALGPQLKIGVLIPKMTHLAATVAGE